jgi:hypothetical protein
MHHTRQLAGSPAKQPHNHRLLNHAVAALLRSPLHGLISRGLMLITFTGRKSGRSYTTPVTYSQQGEQIVFHSTQRWWKNLEGGARVTLRLRGRDRVGYALPTHDVPTIIAALRAFLERKGHNRAGMIDLSLTEPGRPPTDAELEAAARQRVLVMVTLDQEPSRS